MQSFWFVLLLYIFVIILVLGVCGVFTGVGQNITDDSRKIDNNSERKNLDRDSYYAINKIHAHSRVLHIGGHEGQEAKTYKEKGITSGIFVEAFPQHFQAMKKNLDEFNTKHKTNYQSFQALLTDQDDVDTTFYYFSNGMSSSIYKPNPKVWAWPDIGVEKEVKLKSVTFPTLVERHNLNVKSCDLLALDVQGAELTILKTMTKYLPYFRTVIVEISTKEYYLGADLFDSIEAFFHRFNFHRVTDIEATHTDVVFENQNYADRWLNFYKIPKSCQVPRLAEMYSKFLGNTRRGSFVEFGAYDGETVSNTCGLADSGWRGLYIEAVPDYAKTCMQRHSKNNVVVEQCAIGPEDSVISLHVAGMYTTFSDSFQKVYKQWDGVNMGEETLQVRQRPLEDVLVQHLINPSFDLLVVDVEGHEWAALQNFDIAKWKPKMVIIEIEDNHFSFKEGSNYLTEEEYEPIRQNFRNLRKYFSDNSYHIVFKDFINTVYVRNDLLVI